MKYLALLAIMTALGCNSVAHDPTDDSPPVTVQDGATLLMTIRVDHGKPPVANIQTGNPVIVVIDGFTIFKEDK